MMPGSVNNGKSNSSVSTWHLGNGSATVAAANSLRAFFKRICLQFFVEHLIQVVCPGPNPPCGGTWLISRSVCDACMMGAASRGVAIEHDFRASRGD